MSHWPRWILALLLLLITPITVAADYTVLIDSDNNAGTGCIVGSVSGVDYRINAQLNDSPVSVSQTVEQCQSGSFVASARTSLSAMGLNTGPAASDVIELGIDFALTELLVNNSSRPAQITLYGLANGTAGASDSTGAASLSVLVPSTGIPTLEVWALMLLALGLAAYSIIWLKRYSVQPLVLVFVLLACSGGLVWALNNIVVDGQVADWSGLVPINDDADNDSSAPNSEILALWGYYSTTQQRLFLRFDLADIENQPPITQVDGYSTDEDVLLNATTSVLSNDNDPDGNSALLTAQLVTTTSHGVLTLASDGTFTYQPDANFFGVDSFIYKARDALSADSAETTVTITVTAINDAPSVTVPSAQTVDEDTPLSVTGISVADVDAGTGALTLTLSVNHGTVELASTTNLTAVTAGPAASIEYTGSLTDLNAALGAGVVYQPTAGYGGSDTLTLAIDDQGNTGTGGALSDSDTVAITVTAVNDAPSITVPSAQSVNEDGSLSLSTANSNALSVADVDAGTGALKLTLSVDHGTVELASTTNLTAVTAGPAASIEYTGSLTDLNAALGAGVVYQPTAGYSGSDTLIVVIDDQGNTGTGGALSDSDTVAITVTAINDAPSVTVPSAQTVDEDTPLSVTGISVADVDAGTSALKLTLSVDHGTVELASTTNLTAMTAGPAASIEYTGSLTDLNAALGAGVVYQPTAGYSGSDTLTVAIDDQGNTGTGGALSDSDTVAITVTAINDAPSVTVPSAQSVNEDGSLSLSTANSNALSVADVDAGTSALKLTLSVNHGTVELASTTNLTAVTAGPAASIEYTGSLSDLNAALGVGVVYQPTANYVGSDTLTVVIDDQGNTGTGGALSDSDTVAITVTAVNDAPTVTVPSAQSVNEDGSLSLSTANSNALSVADVDAGTGALTLTLSVNHGTVELASTTNLTAVTAGPAASIEYTGSLTDLNAALGAGVVYQPTAGYGGSDTLTLAIDDQGNTGTGGALSDSDTVAITVTAVNDAPSVTVPSAQSVNEDGSLSLSTANSNALSVADVDAGTGALKLTLSVDHGVVSLASTTNLTAVTAGPAASIEYTGSLTDLNAALGAGVVYQPTAGYNGSDTLTVAIDDQGNTGTGGALSDSDTVAITVTAVNDAPSITVPSAQTVDEDGSLSLSTANSNALSVADVDAGTSALKLTLSVNHGTVELASTTNLTAVTAGPAASIEYTGSLSDLNAALGAGVVYQPTAGYSGSDTLTVVIDDQGNTGTGGALSDSDTVAITVAAVNDAPSVTVPSAQTVDEDTPLSVTGISVADVDAGTGALTLTLSVNHGTVELASTTNLTAVTAGPAASIEYTGSLSDLNAALGVGVVYQPTANYVGSATLTVAIDDQGNTGTGGALSDSDTVAITVTAVNDAPTVTVPSAQSVNEDTSLSVTGISVADVDAGTGALKLTLSVNHGTVSLASTGGLTAVGVFTPPAASISYTGTLSAINTALASVNYQGAADYNGSDTLTVAIDDQGNTGTGGALSDSDTVAITVIPVNDAPRLLNKSYTVLANTGINVPDGVDDLLTGAVEVEGEGIVLSALTVSPHNAGIVNASAGSFTFKPQAGFTGTANLTYSACDTHTPTAACSTANLTVTVSGPVVWYVNPAVVGPGTGTLSDPFKLLSGAQSAEAASSANHSIFLDGGTHSTGITLKAGQKLIGDGAAGSFDTVFGYNTIPSYTDTRPTFSGTRPVVQGTVQLSTSNTVSDFNITPAAGTRGLVGVSSTGMNVSNMNVTTSTAAALDISAGSTGSVTLGTVQATGASSGVLLAGSNLTLTVSNTTVNNATGNAVGISSMNGALTFNNTNVTNAGSSAISITNTQGQLAFNNCTINGNIGATRSVDVSLSSGTLSLLKFDNCDVTRATLGGTAIGVNLPSGSTATVSDLQVINGSSLTNHSTALEVFAQGSSRISSLTVTNSSLNGQSTGLDLAANNTAEIQALNVSNNNLTGSATTSINAYATASAKIGTVAGSRSISSNTTATSNVNKIVNWIHSETAATPAPIVLGISNNTVSSFGDSGISVDALGGKSSIDVHLLSNTVQGDLSNSTLAGMYLGVGNTDNTATDRLCAKVAANRITITNSFPNGIYLSPDGTSVRLYIDGLGVGVVENFLSTTNSITATAGPVFAASSINSATCVVP